MNYKVVLQKSEEGYSVSCPGLPGCWSQCETEEEALANIQDAIRALEKAGFYVARQGKHTVMTDAVRIVTIPRDAGLTVEAFKKLLLCEK